MCQKNRHILLLLSHTLNAPDSARRVPTFVCANSPDCTDTACRVLPQRRLGTLKATMISIMGFAAFSIWRGADLTVVSTKAAGARQIERAPGEEDISGYGSVIPLTCHHPEIRATNRAEIGNLIVAAVDVNQCIVKRHIHSVQLIVVANQTLQEREI